MNVLLVSQCDKRALTETRRILDQFAERRGDRTWQTPITQDGLDTLRTLLRKTARKNTAVACHWIRGLDHSELLWIVGDRRRFNDQGAVPTNTTQRDVLRREDENDWHSGEDIRLLATLAALLHDLGKAMAQFQRRLLATEAVGRNQIRHEWVSLRLFQAFVGGDQDDAGWLRRLAEGSADEAAWLARLQRDGCDAGCDRPLATLPPLARAVGWLVLTHHRLPVMPSMAGDTRLGRKLRDFRIEHLHDVLGSIDAGWNEHRDSNDKKLLATYWRFQHGLPVTHPDWHHQAARTARSLLKRRERHGDIDWVANPYVMHVARLALMLADHHYSGLSRPGDRVRVADGDELKAYANTHIEHGQRRLNQTLVEHLVGVGRHCAELCHAFPRFERHLPRLVRHKPLQKRSTDARFRWQDQAAELATAMRGAAAAGGAFIVNMASTGCGKTLANARVMDALAEPALGLRCCFALGLRTLTLQTARALRQAARLHEDDVAVCVGGAASRELFEYHEQSAEATGSASRAPLLGDDGGGVRFEGNTDAHPLLSRALADADVRRLLAAPVLVCTIDHLVPATESQRGGRQIAPMLRLMSSDLVIDELDDFDIDDLPAVARLVHWAGLLGSRVLISSATLPPSLVQGLFEAYRAGRSHYALNRGTVPGATAPIACAWIDEFHRDRLDCSDPAAFAAAQLAFVQRRAQALAKAPVRRRGELWPLDLDGADAATRRRQFAEQVLQAALALHRRHHGTDPATGRRVSFGLVRMANIGPLFDVALALYAMGAPAGARIHLCTYHSQYPLLLRSAIETQLDGVLDRRDPAAAFRHAAVRAGLDTHDEQDHLFIVLGSPVTEVGRDHDYDWAVVEPSSMRSLIQLAGRVWRHRPDKVCGQPNVVLFDSNLKCWPMSATRVAYHKPGFETAQDFPLDAKRLDELLAHAEWEQIDARPRILPRAAAELQPRRSLVDLEHARLRQCMLASSAPAAPKPRRGAAPAAPALGAYPWWQLPPQDALLTAVLQQQQPFREGGREEVEACLLPDEDVERGYQLVFLVEQERSVGPRRRFVPIKHDSLHKPIADERVQGAGINAWQACDYLQALTDLAEALDMPLHACAQRYGLVGLPRTDWGWHFHPALGFNEA